jgi:hypothetical protein
MRKHSYKFKHIELTYKSRQHSAYAGKRGFIVDDSIVTLMNLWLQGHFNGNAI